MWSILFALSLAAVQHVGELREVIAGQDASVIELSSFKGRPHFYGLGPLAGRQGEILVFDSEFLVSTVVQGRVQVTKTDRAGAAFFVYSQVPRWHKVLDFQGQMPSLDSLLEEPSPFLVRGRAKRLDLHILDRQCQEAVGPEAHRGLQVHFTCQDRSIEALGFWSDRHYGLFTPASSKVHLHARTLDNQLMGHVESLEMEAGELWLPEPNPRALEP